MPDARLTRTRATLPVDYQFGDMQTECSFCGFALWLGGDHPECVSPDCIEAVFEAERQRDARAFGGPQWESQKESNLR